VARILNETAALSLVSHLFWTVWAVIQSRLSDIEFDYFSYAQRSHPTRAI
jgi:hypothetical protein